MPSHRGTKRGQKKELWIVFAASYSQGRRSTAPDPCPSGPLLDRTGMGLQRMKPLGPWLNEVKLQGTFYPTTAEGPIRITCRLPGHPQ